MENKKWVAVHGWENNYEGSNMGEIRNVKTKRLKKQQKNNRGYNVCQFENSEKKETVLVHRIVAFAFCLRHNSNAVVNHKDNDKNNNTALNLEWVSQKENVNHAIANGFSNPSLAGKKGLATRWKKQI